MATNPVGKFRGRIESIDEEIKESPNEGTPFYSCTAVITEEGEHKGARVPWTAWLSPDAAVRTFQSFLAAGCTFPNDDFANFVGIGSRDVMLDIEDDSFTPKPTDDNKAPTLVHRSRVAWVNNLVRGMQGKAITADAKKNLGATVLKGALAAARAGRKGAVGGESPADGVPKNPDGTDKF